MAWNSMQVGNKELKQGCLCRIKKDVYKTTNGSLPGLKIVFAGDGIFLYLGKSSSKTKEYYFLDPDWQIVTLHNSNIITSSPNYKPERQVEDWLEIVCK